MGKRIIVTNGDWTTSHELGDSAIVIGRDPNCDLFFVNQKLSRRHARIEPGPDGVRLVDLGSRNGMWVNEEKVGERLLRSGDAIRLGGLEIAFEEDSLPAEPEPEIPESEEPTIILPAQPPDGTVALQASEPAPRSSGAPSETRADATVAVAGGERASDKTVMLAPNSQDAPDGGNGSQTVVLPKGATDSGDDSATIVLGRGPASPEEDSGTVVLGQAPGDSAEGSATVIHTKEPVESDETSATVVLRGSEKPQNDEDEVEETRYFRGEEATLARVADAPLLVPEEESGTGAVRPTPMSRLNEARRAVEAFLARAADRFAALQWEAKFVLILSGVGLTVTTMLAIIALRTNSALVGVLAGLPLIFGWAYTAVVLARHFTVRPVAELAEDVKVLGRGEKPPILSRKDYPELDLLSTEIGRLVGLARSSSASTDSGVSGPNDSDSD